ncbi:MAG: class I SAM-dependent methyltransferase [Desulfobulbia bacterium]|jgi:ubiquinone/menaquinone biosynthesis C-methylase UbiE
MKNIDLKTVEGFGREWASFDQSGLSDEEKSKIFDDYFHLFPWGKLTADAVGLDIGCGSGRWAAVVAPRVGHLHLVDASQDALQVAKKNLSKLRNCGFHHASVGDLPFLENSLDFAYSLGVLHHVPDTAAAIKSVAKRLKPGAPFLVYLYYAFDNRPLWFRMMWGGADVARRLISRLPYVLRLLICQLISVLIYLPFARVACLFDSVGALPSAWPLAYYRDKSFYVMRTDALDRFGTRLEQRFSRQQIELMLENAGFKDIHFSDKPPYWCAVAVKG